MSEVLKKAEKLYLDGFNCAQSAFGALAEKAGVELDYALLTATPFGGGICGAQGFCGALSGAFMAIGIKYGKTKKDDEAAKIKTVDLCKEIEREFIEKIGSNNCREITKCDFSTSEGWEEHLKTRNTVCMNCVLSAVELAEKRL